MATPSETPPLLWLPDDCLLSILQRVETSAISLACKRLLELDSRERHFIRLGTGLHPAHSALLRICKRFPAIEVLHINYLGWASKFGAQIGDAELALIAQQCANLKELSLSFCGFTTDAGLAYLVALKNLTSLTLNFTPGVTGRGLLSVVSGCRLEALHLERCLRLRGSEWIEYLGRAGSLKKLSLINCRGIGEGDLARLGNGWNHLEELTFEQDVDTREVLVHPVEAFQHVDVSCPSLKVLKLVNCPKVRGEGLAKVLSCCSTLEEVSLFSCPGILDLDLLYILRRCNGIKILRLELYKHLGRNPVHQAHAHGMTTACLPYISENCPQVHDLELQCHDEFASSASIFGGFADAHIQAIVSNCNHLHRLTLGRGLHVTPKVLEDLPKSLELRVLDH